MQVAYAVIWWLAIAVIGLIAFPLVSRMCGRLQDRGYSISRVLGLLLVTYFSWLLASARVVQFGYVNISVSLLLLLALSLILGRKHLNPRHLPLRSMLRTEALFTAAFSAFLVFLWYKPDIYFAYSEDFMDFAFLQSVLRSDYFPPSDPWLAGETIPYYYGGQLLVAVVTMLSRVPPGIAYNLAVATFFALAACASFGIGYNATGRKLYGFLAVAFVLLVGYVSGVFQLAARMTGSELLGYGARETLGFVDWLATFDLGVQVIPNTGNAYPYSAFLQGELHANTMSIPFQLMYITLLLALLKRGDTNSGSSKTDSILNVFLLSLGLGFFSFVNSWDYPAYLALTLLAFTLLKIDLNRKGKAGVIALSLLMYLPYYISIDAGGIHGIGLVAERTVLIEFLEIFALFLFALLSLAWVLGVRKLFKGKTLIATAILVVAAALVAFLLDFQLILVLVPLILLPLYFLRKSRAKGKTAFMLLLVLTGALIVLFCEIFYVDDALSAPFERFNTVYKLYLQVWVLWGLASAYAVFWVLGNSRRIVRVAWSAVLIVLILACIIQPIGLTAGWTSGKQTIFGLNRGTLDGLAYVRTLAPGDYEAVKWINENIEGSPTILEAPGAAYQFTSRISTMTGLPTVVGWLTHEVMWRGSWDKVAGRDSDVDTIYRTADEEKAISLLAKYGVEYIYIGSLEKERYGPAGLAKFADDPESYGLLYRSLDVEIYQVLP